MGDEQSDHGSQRGVALPGKGHDIQTTSTSIIFFFALLLSTGAFGHDSQPPSAELKDRLTAANVILDKHPALFPTHPPTPSKMIESAQWGNWGNWGNWNNWSNWDNWDNWGNFWENRWLNY